MQTVWNDFDIFTFQKQYQMTKRKIAVDQSLRASFKLFLAVHYTHSTGSNSPHSVRGFRGIRDTSCTA